MMNARGFTLFELLIALTVAALVAAGLFSMFSAVAGVRDASLTHSDNTIITQAITNLINKDARMMTAGTLGVDASEKIKKLKFTTQNSLRFNKAVPVDIIYYVKDGWIMRREANSRLLYDMEMKLIPEVSGMDLEFYNGNEYKEETVPGAKIFTITLIINGSPLRILAARTVDNI